MAKYIDGRRIAANGNYDVSVVRGRTYGFEVYYDASATGTVTVFQRGPDGSTYQAASWGVDPAADTAISIAASGTARASRITATSDIIRFTVASISGALRIAIFEIPAGR